MKKYIFAVIAFVVTMFSLPALAEPVFAAHAGADTNFVFRGQTLSQRGLSGNFDASASMAGVTGTYALHSVNIGNTNALHILDVNYSQSVTEQLKLTAGTTGYLFTGGATNGVAAKNDNFGEVYVRADALGLFAKYAVRVSNPVGIVGRDSYLNVGYAFSPLDKTNVVVDYELLDYRAIRATSNNFGLAASYSLTPSVAVGAKYVYVGYAPNGIKGANQVAANIKYTF